MIGTWGRGLCAVAGELADEVKVGGSANPAVVPFIRDYIAVGEKRLAAPLAVSKLPLGRSRWSTMTVTRRGRWHAKRLCSTCP
jgi:hypothetical protein